MMIAVSVLTFRGPFRGPFLAQRRQLLGSNTLAVLRVSAAAGMRRAERDFTSCAGAAARSVRPRRLLAGFSARTCSRGAIPGATPDARKARFAGVFESRMRLSTCARAQPSACEIDETSCGASRARCGRRLRYRDHACGDRRDAVLARMPPCVAAGILGGVAFSALEAVAERPRPRPGRRVRPRLRDVPRDGARDSVVVGGLTRFVRCCRRRQPHRGRRPRSESRGRAPGCRGACRTS